MAIKSIERDNNGMILNFDDETRQSDNQSFRKILAWDDIQDSIIASLVDPSPR